MQRWPQGETRRVRREASQCNTQLTRLIHYTGGLAHLVTRTRHEKARSSRLVTKRGELRGCLVLTRLTRQNIWHSGCNSSLVQ